ncbi:Villin headpiece domain-containing protein [Dirofilaria immitis]|nr:Villin headpiece domain-containing protein [Dirofilaria immitis]
MFTKEREAVNSGVCLGLMKKSVESIVLEEFIPANIAAEMNTVYEVDEYYDKYRISLGQVPKFCVLHSEKGIRKLDGIEREKETASTIISAVGKDGEELLSTDCDLSLPFSLRQEVGQNTIMVDQDNRLWLWSDKKLIRLHYVYLTLTALVVMQSSLQYPPIDFDELLRLRTKTSPLEKVTDRDLPSGVGLNRLEQYLNDDEFQSVFQME